MFARIKPQRRQRQATLGALQLFAYRDRKLLLIYGQVLEQGVGVTGTGLLVVSLPTQRHRPASTPVVIDHYVQYLIAFRYRICLLKTADIGSRAAFSLQEPGIEFQCCCLSFTSGQR
ncbi:hypothetical protein D3C77_366570 [compost metagenome]